MPSPSPALAGLTPAAVGELARAAGLPASLVTVHRRWLRSGEPDPSLESLGSLALPAVRDVVSEAGDTGETRKVLLALGDGLECECVWLPMGRGRYSLCVSSQVGCKMGCVFCETGRMGLLRQLTAAEIVGQLLVVRHGLGWPFDRIVFMGMGEPLDNLSGVLPALRVITDPGSLSMGQDRITVCTVGRSAGIRALADEGYRRLNLTLSLNAATDSLRAQIVPAHRHDRLTDIQAALTQYRPRDNFSVGINYCLLPDINDSRRDATAIAAFCRPLGRCLVYLIPYNPGSRPVTRAPSTDEVDQFVGWLREEGVAVRRRVVKGRSVMAACGQLGNLELRRQRV